MMFLKRAGIQCVVSLKMDGQTEKLAAKSLKSKVRMKGGLDLTAVV